jgi:hypothetical protein
VTLLSETKATDLTNFIRDVKRQVKESEDPRPEEGFWTGINSIELEVNAITEKKAGGGVKILILHGDAEVSTQQIQKVKIGLVTQDFNKELRQLNTKEILFSKLLRNTATFREGKGKEDLKEEFYEAYRQIWLYATDETILKINNFFYATGAKRQTIDELSESDLKHAEMILQLRQEFYGTTKLKPENYLIIRFKSNEKRE